jgi:hypothetical protein
MGKFEIKSRLTGEFQFDLKAGNGQIILRSEGYIAKNSCENGIQSVIKNSMDDSKFERITSKNGKFYFNLKSINGEIIGTSAMYDSDAACENGIKSVKKSSAEATIADHTT